MIDALKEEWIVNKVGGRFKLSALIQKRMVALNSGARPLVDLKTKFPMEIVIPRNLPQERFNSTRTTTSASPANCRAGRLSLICRHCESRCREDWTG